MMDSRAAAYTWKTGKARHAEAHPYTHAESSGTLASLLLLFSQRAIKEANQVHCEFAEFMI
jgi:hypothetical protein